MRQIFSTTTSTNDNSHCLSTMTIIINMINDVTEKLESAFSRRELRLPQFYHDLQHYSYTISEPDVLELYKQSITLLLNLYQKVLEQRRLKPDILCIQEWNSIIRKLMSKEIAQLYLQSYPAALDLHLESKNVLPGTFTGRMLYAISTLLPQQSSDNDTL